MKCQQCGRIQILLDQSSEPDDWTCHECLQQSHSLGGDLVETRSLHDLDPVQFRIPERFQSGKIIGEGSFGIVSQCWDSKLHRDVAVKFSKSGMVHSDLFLREARLASRLKHEFIVRIFDADEYEGSPFIVSEFIAGVTLREWMKDDSHTAAERLQMVVKLADGIEYAHRFGIIHRDLKPANVMVDENGQPRILDFGLSRSVTSEEETLMQPGKKIGTPAFMSPEQVRGSRDEVSEVSDVYALGVILFQMLTRQLPFSGSVEQVFDAIILDSNTPSLRKLNRAIPAPLEAICLKAMAKNPEDRYQTAAAMAADLRAYDDGKPIIAFRKMYARRANFLFRRRGLAVATLLLTGLVGAGAWWMITDYREDHPLVPVMMNVNSPEPARLAWTRIDDKTGLIDVTTTNINMADKPIRLPPGFYRVIAKSGNDSMEVFRTVPASLTSATTLSRQIDGQQIFFKHRSSSVAGSQIELPDIEWVSVQSVRNNMAFFPATKIKLPDDNFVLLLFRGQTRELDDFLIATNEVTWDELVRTWPKLNIPADKQRSDPASNIDWDVAVAWCELNGCSLPSVGELTCAATNGGTTRYLVGNERPPTNSDPIVDGHVADWDQTSSAPPIRGLLSGVHEWTEDVFELLQPDENEKLVRNESVSPIREVNSQFPDKVYVVLNLQPRIDQSPTVPGNLANLSVQNPKFPMGFRKVRRLHSASFE